MNKLTKTDFINSFICPTRLNYIKQPKIYTDSTENDEYLQSLSDGGYQIGKLAQLQHEDGIEVSETNYEAIIQTEKLLRNEKCIIFEAAIEYSNFFTESYPIDSDKSNTSCNFSNGKLILINIYKNS